jgi:TRAP-type uncharacterized transport system substrate-binding protein
VRSLALKLAAVAAVATLLGVVIAQLNFRRDLHRLDAAMLSGAPAGNYYVIVGDLATRAARERGKLRNVESEGSIDNVRRLGAAAKSCDVAFALAQDGSDWGDATKLELVARLPKAESVLFLGKGADQMKDFAALAKKRIGVGPAGGGGARIAPQIFALDELRGIGAELSHHPLAEQVELLEKGELDLALFVIDEDAPLILQAVRERGLQIVGFPHADVVARRIPHLRVGRIGAGQYDAVKLLPPEDKRVLRVDTLVIGNGCAGRSQTIDMLVVLARTMPELVRHNKETPNRTGLDLSATARGFFEHEGPEIADEYAPWLVDVMPPANWAYIGLGVSVLFNIMGIGHRFRLWRIDAARVHLESELTKFFGATATLGDIERKAPTGDLAKPEKLAAIDAIIHELEDLSARARRYSLSMLVPMGQEMTYRYQEELMHQTLAVLRHFRERSTTAPASTPP